MEIDGGRFSKKCWDLSDLNKTFDSFKKWNKLFFLRVDGAKDIVRESTACCLWMLCFSKLIWTKIEEKRNIEEAFERLGDILVQTYERTIIYSLKFPQMPHALIGEVCYNKEPSIHEMLLAFAVASEARNSKIELVPEEDMSKAFRESLDRYDLMNQMPIFKNFRCKGYSDFINCSLRIIDIVRMYKLCLQLRYDFIESELYKHPALKLGEQTLELAEFFRNVYGLVM